MKRSGKILMIALVAILLGIISFYFINGWYNIIPWGIVALMLGYFSLGRRDGIINGAVFGYVLFLVYIFIGYNGKTDTTGMLHFILFDMFFSFFGLIGGIVGAYIGHLIWEKFARG